MNSFHEGYIDKPTSKLIQDNSKNILKTTDSVSELNDNESVYIDLSNSIKSKQEFMRAFENTCKQIAHYNNKIVYIDMVRWQNTTDSVIHHLLRYIKAYPNSFKNKFAGIRFVFVNTKTDVCFGLEVDKYEASQYATLSNLIEELNKAPEVKRATSTETNKKSTTKTVVDIDKAKAEKLEKNKKELVKKINQIADDSTNVDDAMTKIDTDEDIAKLLNEIEEDEPGKPNINKARASRMTKVNDEFLKASVGTQTVSSLIFGNNAEIKPAHLKVQSINKEQWQNFKFANFEKSYDINKDIYAMLFSLKDKRYPVSVLNMSVEDTSTSMDYTITYKAECEDYNGKRFSLKFDIPKFINDRFMMLRGNEKVMSGQLMLLPCMKTDMDTVQLVSNYKKIFLRRYGMTNKSYPSSDKMIKALGKVKSPNIDISFGDNSIISTKYELPVDYIDLTAILNKVETKSKIYFFDQDVYYKKYNADITAGVPYAVSKKDGTVFYYTDADTSVLMSHKIATEIGAECPEFDELYNKTKAANRLNYTQASIMSSKIPLIVILGYHLGLTGALKRAKIDFDVRSRDHKLVYNPNAQGIIKFEDSVIVYELSYESSMLLNGLSEFDTQEYTLDEAEKRAMWLDMLDECGGRILSDGLENFHDLFMDPITTEICKDIRIPTDYIDLLIYGNNLLVDNKYNRHTDISGNRYRTNEIVAAYFYVALSRAYEQYANSIRRGRGQPMSMKQSAVLDQILTSNISSDLSTLNPLLELTSASTTTFKGPSGMNSDRAYSLDKRTYDDSMINKLALSTGFAANVGIDRQATIDMDVEGVRGYIKKTDKDEMSVTKTFSMSEAVTPFGVTRETI